MIFYNDYANPQTNKIKISKFNIGLLTCSTWSLTDRQLFVKTFRIFKNGLQQFRRLLKFCDLDWFCWPNCYHIFSMCPGIKPHACTKCNYRAATSSNLKRHMQIHDDVRNFHCSICLLNFRQKIHLIRHYKYKHEVIIVHRRLMCCSVALLA